MTLDAIYAAYWSLRDPLFQSQSLPVVRALAAHGWRIAMVTFEQAQWALPPAGSMAARRELQSQGIDWRPLAYHKRPAVLSTVFDVGRGAMTIRRTARREGARLIHARGSIPGAMARPARRAGRIAFLYDADGPLSQEYVDAGVWSVGSPGHRLAALSEARCFADADRVAVLSGIYADELEPRIGQRPVVLPCAVETTHFRPRPAARARLRDELGLAGTVFAYAGKAGGWYLTEPMFDFVDAFQSLAGPATVLILTTQDPSVFESVAERRKIRCVIRSADREAMPEYLSAADVGLSFRKPTPSQRACSPIKNGEYLACGLPVVSTAVAGDYPALLRGERVGIVVDSLAPDAHTRAVAELRTLLADPGTAARCCDVAVREVDLERVVLPRYEALYRELLGAPRG